MKQKLTTIIAVDKYLLTEFHYNAFWENDLITVSIDSRTHVPDLSLLRLLTPTCPALRVSLRIRLNSPAGWVRGWWRQSVESPAVHHSCQRLFWCQHQGPFHKVRETVVKQQDYFHIFYVNNCISTPSFSKQWPEPSVQPIVLDALSTFNNQSTF